MPSLPPLHLIADVLLFAIMPAALVTAIVMVAVDYWGGTKQMPLGAALGLAAGTGVGLWWRGALTLGPDSSWNRLPWLALAALGIGLAARYARLPVLIRWLVPLLTATAVAWLVIPLATRDATLWLVPALAGSILALWVLLEHLAARPPDGSVHLVLAMAFFVAGGVLIHAGTARLTDAAVVVSATLAAIALVAWVRRSDAGGAIPGAAVLLPGLALMGQQETYSDVPWPAFALAALAPLALACTLPLGTWHGLRLTILRLALILVPLATALALAMSTGPLQYE